MGMDMDMDMDMDMGLIKLQRDCYCQKIKKPLHMERFFYLKEYIL